jgi:hypothetical protein
MAISTAHGSLLSISRSSFVLDDERGVIGLGDVDDA